MNISYYSVFEYTNGDIINIYYPDIPYIATFAESYDTAIIMARDLLELYLDELCLENLPIASSITQLILKENEKAVKIDVEVLCENNIIRSPNVIRFSNNNPV